MPLVQLAAHGSNDWRGMWYTRWWPPSDMFDFSYKTYFTAPKIVKFGRRLFFNMAEAALCGRPTVYNWADQRVDIMFATSSPSKLGQIWPYTIIYPRVAPPQYELDWVEYHIVFMVIGSHWAYLYGAFGLFLIVIALWESTHFVGQMDFTRKVPLQMAL